MIQNIKLFVNNNDESIKTAKLIRNKLELNGFKINDNNYDLGIAVGGDGSFLRMIKSTNYNSNINYVGINSGTLGFMQEVKKDEIDKFINELKENIAPRWYAKKTITVEKHGKLFGKSTEVVARIAGERSNSRICKLTTLSRKTDGLKKEAMIYQT